MHRTDCLLTADSGKISWFYSSNGHFGSKTSGTKVELKDPIRRPVKMTGAVGPAGSATFVDSQKGAVNPPTKLTTPQGGLTLPAACLLYDSDIKISDIGYPISMRRTGAEFFQKHLQLFDFERVLATAKFAARFRRFIFLNYTFNFKMPKQSECVAEPLLRATTAIL